VKYRIAPDLELIMPARTTRQGMTVEELLALPVSFELWPTAAKAIGIGRSQVYELASRDELPFPVIHLGNSLRVARADLLRSLGMDPHAVAHSCGCKGAGAGS